MIQIIESENNLIEIEQKWLDVFFTEYPDYILNINTSSFLPPHPKLNNLIKHIEVSSNKSSNNWSIERKEKFSLSKMGSKHPRKGLKQMEGTVEKRRNSLKEYYK